MRTKNATKITSKLYRDVKIIKKLNTWLYQEDIADMFGISQTTVSKILRSKNFLDYKGLQKTIKIKRKSKKAIEKKIGVLHKVHCLLFGHNKSNKGRCIVCGKGNK